MRQISFIIALLTFFVSSAQGVRKSEEELKEKAHAEINALERELDSKTELSIDEFLNNRTEADSTKFREKVYENYSDLVRMFPKSENFSRYLYCKGKWTSNNDEAKDCFKKVIEINKWQYYVGKSYMRLSYFAIKEKDFATALQYLEIAERMPEPIFICGNERQDYYNDLKNVHKSFDAAIKK
jgi:tetratricopeptide (TPR) repeat protein